MFPSDLLIFDITRWRGKQECFQDDLSCVEFNIKARTIPYTLPPLHQPPSTINSGDGWNEGRGCSFWQNHIPLIFTGEPAQGGPPPALSRGLSEVNVKISVINYRNPRLYRSVDRQFSPLLLFLKY